MKPKGRYNIRLCQRHQVNIEFSNNSQNIPLFYDLFWETAQRQYFFAEPYGFFINLCQTLFTANMAEIGLATWKVALVSWLMGLCVLVLVTYVYPLITKYNVFAEIERRNNPPTTVNLAV